ncbi:MAG: hypothetical protein IIB77_11860, partial [Proteobacteria bacterium]|nr:hypothetical protein [Pseudomonadota bacterium]
MRTNIAVSVLLACMLSGIANAQEDQAASAQEDQVANAQEDQAAAPQEEQAASADADAPTGKQEQSLSCTMEYAPVCGVDSN